ncbi:hypothetical protein B0T25DRAFT_158838 [Lasiosphaeria hispida]|uniref:intramembrane prenyl-peptidase Rce1 n=1 Tax=Lasiosphaeria hispida TaxID=260671 RepID=A0AAJ0HM66_9PEZI|nr:hypothetical protein B0T25DRAFT_158838 [Lasiosphaeria hispida]
MPPITAMLHRLNPWHQKDAPPPPITTRTASALLVLYALVYFLPFYASKITRPSITLSRDAPSVIRARIRSVTISCLLCGAATSGILAKAANASVFDILHLTGIWPAAVLGSGRVLFLTALLFAGPLFSYFIVDSGWREWARLEPFHELWEEWPAWRNIVAGPVTEELLFRSASVPLMLLAQAPLNQTIFLSPVIFGLAHVHHFYEFRLTHPEVPATAALLRSLFQLVYTTLFGAYSTFLFVRSGSLLAVCAVHAFCNCMGLPQLWGRVTPARPSIRERLLRGQSGGGEEKPPSVLWTVAYYILLVAGSVAWYKGLWMLTESENALVPVAAWASSGSKA